MSIHTAKIELNGEEYSIETGRFAKQADGSVMVRHGDTMVLVTVVAAKEAKPDLNFLPLTVEYREKNAAAGKIPGGFLKREGRPADREILAARLIDRPCRPMFPKTWRFETQIVATVYSSEPEIYADTLAVVGASAALMISPIPFAGPISEVRVGRLNGEFICNPSHSQSKDCDIDITIAATDENIAMVEGACNEISEEDFLAALAFGHDQIRVLNKMQRDLVAQFSKPKREFAEPVKNEDLYAFLKDLATEKVKVHVRQGSSKEERHEFKAALVEEALVLVNEKYAETEGFDLAKFTADTKEFIEKIIKTEMRLMILNENLRLDGRTTTTIRPITCEIGVLPRTHGSALFTRGETQSLTTVTLGTKDDEQLIDGLLPTYTNSFMLHYNFPPFCTGEVGRMTGVSRREVGHGHLAQIALTGMLPEQSDFPYTIRIVSDILESNGSSSMATVCAGSLALFQAGVPMKKPVAGIAMGLIKEEEDVAILSDILGDEDFLGDMDFKVTGTEDGITACQMDIKIAGISKEIMAKALNQAKAGRLHILGIMNEAIPTPSEEMSPFAPRLTTIMIPQDMIGAVIGPGGENIRALTRETETTINIEDDGKCIIAATSQEQAFEAISRIEAIIRRPEVGDIYKAKVKEVREGLGAIMEFLPKKSGLLHISQIAHERIEKVSDVIKAGDIIEVKLIEIQADGKYRLSRKALLERPKMEPRPEPKA